MSAELWLLLAPWASHPRGDAHFLPCSENVSLWRRGPFLQHCFSSFVTFRNVTLEQTWKQLCWASAEPPFFRKCWKASFKMTLSEVNVEVHVAFSELEHLSVAQIVLTEDEMLHLLPGCSNMSCKAGRDVLEWRCARDHDTDEDADMTSDSSVFSADTAQIWSAQLC